MVISQLSTAFRLRRSPLAVCLGAALALGAVAPVVGAGTAAPAIPSPLHRRIRAADPVPEGLRRRAAAAKASAHDTPAPTGGITVPVTSCADDGGSGTLRHAALIASAGDTIDLSALTCSTITLVSGAINIDVDAVTLLGPGASVLAIDGNENGRVFHHSGSGALTLVDVTVTHGNYAVVGTGYGGGCIYSKGSVSLNGAVVSSCTVTGTDAAIGGGILALDGVIMVDSALQNNTAIASVGMTGTAAVAGGAFAEYEIVVEHSTVSGNSVTAALGNVYGGGVFGGRGLVSKYSTFTGNRASTTNTGSGYYGFGGGIVSRAPVIQNSTIDNNIADAAAGMYLFSNDPGYAAQIRNSTISSNHAVLAGGGLFTKGDLKLENCTIAFNVGGTQGAGGLLIAGPTTELESNIIADNSPSGPSGAADYDGASVVTGANNLIKISGAMVTVPPDTITQDPQLGPLAPNGGETRTHALSATSPALDVGNNLDGLYYDQRGPGFAREVGGTADIGAYELDPDIVFADGFDVGG